MSKIIRSNRVNLSEGSYKLSSEVFIDKEKFISKQSSKKNKADASDAENVEKESSESAKSTMPEEYSPDSLIERAESAAIEIMDNAQALADELIAEARQSARELEEEAVENTNFAYESAKEKGREDGYREVYDEAFQAGKREADLLIEKANQELEEALEIKRSLEIKNKEFYVDKEAEMIKLVLEIAKKVIGKEIHEVDYIESLIGEAMKHLNYATDIVLRVSEHDYDSASLAKPKILAMAERIESLEIKIDYALPRGSCMIDTNTGSIDASIKTQLERIEDMFNNILASNEKEFQNAEGLT